MIIEPNEDDLCAAVTSNYRYDPDAYTLTIGSDGVVFEEDSYLVIDIESAKNLLLTLKVIVLRLILVIFR